MSSTTKLLPCPFCSNADISIKNENPKDNSGGYFIECPGCGASTSLRFACCDDPTHLLTDQWNRRTAAHCLHQIQEPAPTPEAHPITDDERRSLIAAAGFLTGSGWTESATLLQRIAVGAPMLAVQLLKLMWEEFVEPDDYEDGDHPLADRVRAFLANMPATDADGYPDLPAGDHPGAYVSDAKVFNANEMRAYLDTDRALRATASQAAPAAVALALPEPDGFLESHPFGSIYHRGKPSQMQTFCGACPPMYEAGTVRALLAGTPAPEAQQTRTWRGGKLTVADLVNNLLMMDQALPIYGAQYIEHPPGKRQAIAVPPTVSRERVKDSRWIGEGESLNAAVIWTRAEQPAPQVTLDYPWRDRLLDGRPLVRDAMGFAEHPELPQLDEGMRAKAFYAALGVEIRHTMAEDDLSMDEYGAMNDAENWSNWAPKPPNGEAWNLVAVFDTEDGPAAWWMRELRTNQKGIAA